MTEIFQRQIAIIHDNPTRIDLQNRLHTLKIQVVYFSEYIPKSFLQILSSSKAEGAIMHNVIIDDEKALQEALKNNYKLALIMSLASTQEHRDMYNRLESQGCLVVPRSTNRDRLIQKYIKLLEGKL